MTFGAMFLSSLFVGRLWCGWACPAGALQEIAEPISRKPMLGSRFNWIKWGVWLPWMLLIVAMAMRAGGFHSVQPYSNSRGARR